MWRERIVSLWTNAPIFYESSNDLIQYFILHIYLHCLCSVYQIQKEGEPIFAVDEESLLRTDHTISYCNSVFHNVSSMWQRAAGYYVRLISTFVSDTHSVSLTPPPTLSISPPSSFLSIATFELIKNWIRAA